MQTFTLKLPKIFTNDHLDRLGGELGLWEELKEDSRTITVRMDRPSLDSLEGDAKWYADRRNHDTEWPSLVRGAKRTVELCRQARCG